jgi:hypothetical protein
MIDTSDIKQMVTHILRRQRGVPNREPMDPGREWILGVFATVILVVLGGAISYGFYLNTISLEVDIDRVPAVAIPYNAAVVDQAVLEFQARADAYGAIRGVGDPEPSTPVPVATTTESSPVTTIENTESTSTTTSPSEVIDVPPQSDPLPPEPANEEARPDLGV